MCPTSAAATAGWRPMERCRAAAVGFVCVFAAALLQGAAGARLHQSNRSGAPPTGLVLAGTSDGRRYRQRLENYEDMQYHGKLELGGQVIRAIYDTGSFDILVVSAQCQQCPSPVYNSSASPTFHAQGDDIVEHSFGSGPTESSLGFENVQIGPLEARNQTIHLILRHNMSVLDNASFDAIVGIGPEDNRGEQSLSQNLGISEYSLCLERAPGAPGWLTWGGDLTAEQKANAASLRVVGKYHWAVSMREFLPDVPLSGKRLDAAQTLLCGKGCAAILDSGTSLIVGPSHSLQALAHLLPRLHENCSNFGDLPDLELTLSGRRLRLPPEVYAFRMRGTPEEKRRAGDLLHAAPASVAEDVCFYAFSASNQHTDYGPLWVLGMPFFRHFHVTFHLSKDRKDRHMWLARASESCQPLPLDCEDDGKANSTYEGFGVYPKVIVAQRGQYHRRSTPRIIKASALLLPRPVGVL